MATRKTISLAHKKFKFNNHYMGYIFFNESNILTRADYVELSNYFSWFTILYFVFFFCDACFLQVL